MLVIDQETLSLKQKQKVILCCIPCRWWWRPSIFSPSRPGLDSVGPICQPHKYESTSTCSYTIRTATGLSWNGTNLFTRQSQPNCKSLLLVTVNWVSQTCRTLTRQLFVRMYVEMEQEHSKFIFNVLMIVGSAPCSVSKRTQREWEHTCSIKQSAQQRWPEVSTHPHVR